MGPRTIEEYADLVFQIEQKMLEGVTQAFWLVRDPDMVPHHLSVHTASRIMEKIKERWRKGINAEDISAQREELIRMHLHTLRQTHKILKDAQNSPLLSSLAEQNKAIANITKILTAIADLKGMREKTLRIGGDRERIPIETDQHLAITQLVAHGLLDQRTALQLDDAIIAARTRPSTSESEGIRGVDALPVPGTTS